MSGQTHPAVSGQTHPDASAAFAEAARSVGRALAKLALERLMLRLAHIAVTGRILR